MEHATALSRRHETRHGKGIGEPALSKVIVGEHLNIHGREIKNPRQRLV